MVLPAMAYCYQGRTALEVALQSDQGMKKANSDPASPNRSSTVRSSGIMPTVATFRWEVKSVPREAMAAAP